MSKGHVIVGPLSFSPPRRILYYIVRRIEESIEWVLSSLYDMIVCILVYLTDSLILFMEPMIDQIYRDYKLRTDRIRSKRKH